MSWPVCIQGQILKWQFFFTINGDSVAIMVSDAGILVNDAKVVMADITASNGVIHIINTVLFHKMMM